MLQDKLEPEHARRWGWDRSDDVRGANMVYEPGRDLNDILSFGDTAG